jgi:hypothetical protein
MQPMTVDDLVKRVEPVARTIHGDASSTVTQWSVMAVDFNELVRLARLGEAAEQAADAKVESRHEEESRA